jgi:hypothetical protein
MRSRSTNDAAVSALTRPERVKKIECRACDAVKRGLVQHHLVNLSQVSFFSNREDRPSEPSQLLPSADGAEPM